MSVRDKQDEQQYLAGLNVREVMPGWDTANGYVLIHGQLDFGTERKPFDEVSAPAWQMLACVERAVSDWPVASEIPEPVAQQQPEFGWRWPWVHPLTDSHGVSAALVDVVEEAFPEGEWRLGGWPGIDERMPWVLARLVDGVVVGVIAPAEIGP